MTVVRVIFVQNFKIFCKKKPKRILVAKKICEKESKKFDVKKLGIRNCVGRSTGFMGSPAAMTLWVFAYIPRIFLQKRYGKIKSRSSRRSPYPWSNTVEI